MDAPEVASLSVTDWAVLYVPAAGAKVGVAVCVTLAVILNDITTADQVPELFCVKSIGVAPEALVRYSVAVPPSPYPVPDCMPLPPHVQGATQPVIFQRGLPKP